MSILKKITVSAWAVGALVSPCLALYFGVTPLPSDESARTTVVLTSNSSYLCSGVIVGSHTVLTAAHCVEHMFDPAFPDNGIQVYFPRKYERFVRKTALVERSRAVTAIYRPALRERLIPIYDERTQAREESINDAPDDFAALTISDIYNADGLDRDSPTYKAAVLANPATVLKPDQTMTVAGFGQDETNIAGVLREGKMTYVNRYASGWRASFTMLTLPKEYSTRPCRGDSGGPVFTQQSSSESTEQTVLVGITSAGELYSTNPSLAAKIQSGQPLSAREQCLTEKTIAADIRQYRTVLSQAAVGDPVLTAALTTWR